MEKNPKFRINFVYCIVDKTDNSVVRGVRTADSPFYTSELYAAKKCVEMNNKLMEYGKEPVYQIEEYRLTSNRMIDIYTCEDEICQKIRNNDYRPQNYNGVYKSPDKYVKNKTIDDNYIKYDAYLNENVYLSKKDRGI